MGLLDFLKPKSPGAGKKVVALAALTREQQAELAGLLADGATIEEAAKHFAVSPATISRYKKRLALAGEQPMDGDPSQDLREEEALFKLEAARIKREALQSDPQFRELVLYGSPRKRPLDADTIQAVETWNRERGFELVAISERRRDREDLARLEAAVRERDQRIAELEDEVATFERDGSWQSEVARELRQMAAMYRVPLTGLLLQKMAEAQSRSMTGQIGAAAAAPPVLGSGTAAGESEQPGEGPTGSEGGTPAQTLQVVPPPNPLEAMLQALLDMDPGDAASYVYDMGNAGMAIGPVNLTDVVKLLLPLPKASILPVVLARIPGTPPALVDALEARPDWTQAFLEGMRARHAEVMQQLQAEQQAKAEAGARGPKGATP